ncbi:MAG: hypothetical protein KA004_01925 [Verrucomicrobiales bacterium]|nr:hypothetical protein [Verrucomicrobiales bacterium]
MDAAAVVSRRWTGWCFLAAGIAVFLLFWPSRNFKAITYDDPQFIFGEPRVASGLSLENARWALTSRAERNWIPLARWSHQLDASLFGANAGPPHLVSAALHAINCVLLALLLHRLTGNSCVALLAALAWAVHPLQVEAVAWLSNRKHLLAASGAFAASLCWWRLRPGLPPRWAGAAVFLALSLMARPTAVLLPLVWWWGDRCLRRALDKPWRRFLLPVLLGVVGILVTLWAQSQPDSPFGTKPPLRAGIWLAPAGAAHLVSLFLWPSALAFHYPMPKAVPWDLVAVGAAMLVAAVVFVWRWKYSRPLVSLGLVWMLALWLPASGLIPAGDLLTADRFANLPLAGAVLLFGTLACRLPPAAGRISMVAAVLGILTWTVLARRQLLLWRDAPTLYASAISRQPQDPLPRLQLGLWHAGRGEVEMAGPFFREAVAADPESLLAQYNLAVFALRTMHPEEVLAHAGVLVRERPDFAEGHWLVSQAHYQMADLPKALAAARRVLELNPADLAAQARVAELTATRPRPAKSRRPRGRERLP